VHLFVGSKLCHIDLLSFKWVIFNYKLPITHYQLAIMIAKIFYQKSDFNEKKPWLLKKNYGYGKRQ